MPSMPALSVSWLLSAVAASAAVAVGINSSALERLSMPLAVDVVLVGFDGLGNGGVKVDPADLLAHLRLLQAGDAVPHAQAACGGDGRCRAPRNGSGVDVGIRCPLMYRVRAAPPQLLNGVMSVLVGDVFQKHASVVDPAAVAAHLRHDFLSASPSYALYLLNPELPSIDVGGGGEAMMRTPQYWYDNTQGAGGSKACVSSVWVSPTDRFAFFDLSAAPVSLTARSAADGVVTDTTLPRVFSTHGRPLPGLVPSLAAFVQHTMHQLLLPPFSKFPLPATTAVHIRVVVMSEDGGIPVLHDRDALRFLDATKDLGQWAALLPALAQLEDAIPDQRVTLSVATVAMQSCELCMLALSHSHRDTHYDAAAMRHWLGKSKAPYWGMQGAWEAPPGARAVPVFVMHLSSTTTPTFLDQHHLAVAGDDMVVAVHTGAPPAALDWICNGNARFLSGAELPRAVLAGVLETAFGVADTRTVWNPHRRAFEPNLMWAVGHTPFGPFSDSLTLSFAITDTASRVAVFSSVVHTVDVLRDALHRFDSTGESVADVLPRGSYFEFVEQWKALLATLEDIATACGFHNHHLALDLVGELHTEGLQRLLDGASKRLQLVTSCP